MRKLGILLVVLLCTLSVAAQPGDRHPGLIGGGGESFLSIGPIGVENGFDWSVYTNDFNVQSVDFDVADWTTTGVDDHFIVSFSCVTSAAGNCAFVDLVGNADKRHTP